MYFDPSWVNRNVRLPCVWWEPHFYSDQAIPEPSVPYKIPTRGAVNFNLNSQLQLLRSSYLNSRTATDYVGASGSTAKLWLTHHCVHSSGSSRLL